MTHGKRATYLKGCRCDPCTTATAKWRKTYSVRAHRAGGAIRIDSDPVRRHIELLNERMSLSAIEAAAGIGRGTVCRILKNPTVHPTIAKAILAVPVTAQPLGHLVNATGATRRLQALQAAGWATSKIEALTGGYGRENLRRVMSGHRASIDADIDQRIRAAYDELWDKRPPAASKYDRAAITKAVNRARREGWVPPLAWDDNTIDDPDATPNVGTVERRTTGGTGRPTEHVVDDIAWLLEHDPTLTAAQLADRLGYSDRSGVQIALTRGGRPDLLARLARNAEMSAA